MDLVRWLEERGGVAHRADARAAGFGSTSGAVLIGRAWLAAPNAPAALMMAAQMRGRLTCLSAAEHYGLALLMPPAETHIAVSHNSPTGAPHGVHLHRSRLLSPIGRTSLVVEIADVLAHAAVCASELEAFVLWESALRKRLISRSAVARACWPRTAQRRLAAIVTDSSDSVLESVAAYRLREAGIAFRQQVRLGGRPIDFLIGDRLVLQLDGYEFHREAAQRRSDIEFDARLLIAGYHVIRKDYRAVVHDWTSVLRDLREALLVGLGEARPIRRR